MRVRRTVCAAMYTLLPPSRTLFEKAKVCLFQKQENRLSRQTFNATKKKIAFFIRNATEYMYVPI